MKTTHALWRYSPWLLLLLPLFLVLGLQGGLARLGWWPALTPAGALQHHGLLMVTGFLGSLIGLERALPERSYAGLLGVLLIGSASLALLIQGSLQWPLYVLVAGVSLHLFSFRTERWQLSSWSSLLALLAWLLGSLHLLLSPGYSGSLLSPLICWWGLFLMLTIRGSHLKEPLLPAQRGFVGLQSLALTLGFGGGLLIWPLHAPVAGQALLALGWLLLGLGGLWQLPQLRQQAVLGPAPWLGACFGLAYGWLALSGLGLLFWAWLPGQPADLLAHGVFVGFVFGMILAHAPGVLPRLLGQSAPLFTPWLWLPLVLLQGGLLLRALGGLSLIWPFRAWGGLLNALALGLFLLILILSLMRLRLARWHPKAKEVL